MYSTIYKYDDASWNGKELKFHSRKSFNLSEEIFRFFFGRRPSEFCYPLKSTQRSFIYRRPIRGLSAFISHLCKRPTQIQVPLRVFPWLRTCKNFSLHRILVRSFLRGNLRSSIHRIPASGIWRSLLKGLESIKISGLLFSKV